MSRYEQTLARQRAPLPQRPSLRDLVRFATLAPNAHNTQPWKFRLLNDAVEILPDFSRRTPVVDPDDHHLYVSIGCAAENLLIAANASGRPASLTIEERGPEGTVVQESLGYGEPRDQALCDEIPRRQSTRSDYDGQPLTGTELQDLTAEASLPGVTLLLETDRGRMEEALVLLQQANALQIEDRAFLAELKHWLRFNTTMGLKTGDGLLGITTGNPNAPAWLGALVFGLMFKKGPELRKMARQLRSSAGLAVFVADEESPAGWISVGRSVQRFALQATRLGIRHAHVNMPVEVAAVRPAFAQWLGVPGRRPDIVLRFGKAPPMPMSLRRPVADVIVP